MSDLIDREKDDLPSVWSPMNACQFRNVCRHNDERLAKLEELRSLVAGGHPGPDRGYVLLRSYTFTEETHQRIHQLLEELKGE